MAVVGHINSFLVQNLNFRLKHPNGRLWDRRFPTSTQAKYGSNTKLEIGIRITNSISSSSVNSLADHNSPCSNSSPVSRLFVNITLPNNGFSSEELLTEQFSGKILCQKNTIRASLRRDAVYWFTWTLFRGKHFNLKFLRLKLKLCK